MVIEEDYMRKGFGKVLNYASTVLMNHFFNDKLFCSGMKISNIASLKSAQASGAIVFHQYDDNIQTVWLYKKLI